MPATQEKLQIKYYEILDRKNSGFIMDGTERTPYQQELTAPTIQWIPNTGRTAIYKEGKDGKITKHFVEIRYLSGCDSIIPQEQIEQGFSPKRFEDKIPMENGFVTVVREGDTIGLYDFLEKVFYNADNPDRPDTATPRYRELKLDKKAEELIEEDEMETQAKMLVYELRKATGDKKTPYKYNTDRIDALCRLFNIYDETPERKLILLLQNAKMNPEKFIKMVTKAEQTVITEITHALEMKLIKFDGNTAQYVDENKIIAILGEGKMKEPEKIEKFGSWLATNEGSNALTELRAKLEYAKEQLLKS